MAWMKATVIMENKYDYQCPSCQKEITEEEYNDPNFYCPECENSGLEAFDMQSLFDLQYGN